MDRRLLMQAAGKLFAGLCLLALLLFVPAGTAGYWHGWLLLGVLFVPMLLLGTALLLRDPALLRKRLNAKEKETEQKWVVAGSGLMFLAAFLLAGLNFRFRWTVLPGAVSWAAAGVFLLGYLLYAEVLRENAYLSRTVEVQENQKVIDTGAYGVVRHPMYAATLLMFLSAPLVLGSIPSLAVMLFYPAFIAVRIKNEEQVLEAGLEGYAAYRRRVKYRVIPFIW